MNSIGEGVAASKPGLVKRVFSRAGSALGVEVAPRIETVSDASKSQIQVPPVVESTPQDAPPAASAVATETPSNITPEQPTIVPAEPAAQAPVAEVSMESTVPASNPPEEPDSSALPVDKKEEEGQPSEATEPTISEPSPQEPVVQAETVVPVESAAQEPAKPAGSAVPSMNFGKPEAVEEAVPEDSVATALLSEHPEQFIEDGVLNFVALKAAKEAKLIAQNPKAQNLINQLREAGVVNSEVVSKLVQPILSELPKAA